MYTPGEIKEVQEAIDEYSEMASAKPERRKALVDALQGGVEHNIYCVLALDNPELHQRVTSDKRVAKFGPTAFLPLTAPLVHDSNVDPTLTHFSGTRGNVARFQHPDGDYIVKPYQSTDERIIAPKAGEWGFGPKQFPSIRNIMTEEFVQGVEMTKLRGDNALPEEVLSEMGIKLGRIFRKMAEEDIYYNDLIADDFAKSHVIVGDDREPRLIDFGVALNVSDPRTFTDEQVWQYIRTMPPHNFVWQIDGNYIRSAVADEGPSVRATDKEAMLARQLRLIHQSMSFMRIRIGDGAVESITRGFMEGYREA